MTEVTSQQPSPYSHFKPALQTYYFSKTQPQGTIQEQTARLQTVDNEGDSYKVRFKVYEGFTRRYVEAVIPRANLDEILDMCNTHSTQSLHNKDCKVLSIDNTLVGVGLPALSNRKKQERYLEIRLDSYDGLKNAEKIPAQITDVTSVMDEFKFATIPYKNIIIAWAPTIDNYQGPREPIKLSRETRLKWTHNFGQPIYRSGIFDKPFFVIVQDNAVVGLEYGIKPVAEEVVKSNSESEEKEITQIFGEPPKPRINTKGLPKVTWNSHKWHVAPYYVEELTRMIRGNPQEKLTAMLASAREKQIMHAGNREIFIFDDQSPITSMTILGGNVHEISLNRKLDARAWERQSMEMLLYRSSSQKSETPKMKPTAKKGN